MSISVKINNEEVSSPDQQPRIFNNRTFVPIDPIFEHMGFTVDWTPGTGPDPKGTATLTSSNYTIVVTEDETTFTTNDVIYYHSDGASALIIGGRVMVPVRSILESIGCSIDWDGATQTVIVVTSEIGFHGFYKIKSKVQISGQDQYVSISMLNKDELENGCSTQLKSKSTDAGQWWGFDITNSTVIASYIDPRYSLNCYGINLCKTYEIAPENDVDSQVHFLSSEDGYYRIGLVNRGNRSADWFLNASGTTLFWSPLDVNSDYQKWELEYYDISKTDYYIRSVSNNRYLAGDVFAFPEEGGNQLKSRRLLLRSTYDSARSRYWWRIGTINGIDGSKTKLFSGKTDMSVIGRDISASENENGYSSLDVEDYDSVIELISSGTPNRYKIKLASENKYLTENGSYVCWQNETSGNSQYWDFGAVTFDSTATFGVDVLRIQNQNTCQFLYYNNKVAVGRYYGNRSGAITTTERDIIINSGMSIIALYQFGEPLNYDYTLGETHAAQAILYANSLGQPHGTAIYFAADFGFSYNNMDNIKEYFDGIYSVFKSNSHPYKIGVYSSGDACYVLNNQYDEFNCKKVNYFMIAASTGYPDNYNFKENAHIRQLDQIKYKNVIYDLDLFTCSDYGQWS